jgi:hypothetical protein
MLARLVRPKIIYSPSYVDHRSKNNVITLLDMGYIPRGDQAP